MTTVSDYRLIIFCTATILIGLYSATRNNYFRLVLINFIGDVSRKQFAVSGTDGGSRPQCSFSTFRKYLRQTSSNYLPGDGRWNRRAGKLARFYPDLCSLSYGSWVPRDRLVRCFARLNISYIAILGDSNALRLWGTVRQTLSAVGVPRVLNCDAVRHDDVITPELPARPCSSNYLSLRRFLPPKYFRCKMTVAGLSVRSLLVQYLPVTGDTMPIDAILNNITTGCVDNKTSTFVQTQASTVQVGSTHLPEKVF